MTGTPLDLTARVFTRLTVLSRAGHDRHGFVLWLCECECGAVVRIRARSLTAGLTKSCGCLKAESMRRVQRARAESMRARRAA